MAVLQGLQPRHVLVPLLVAALCFTVAVLVPRVDGATGGPTDEQKLQKVAELFTYAKTGDIARFQAGFGDEATYQYSGGPGLPYTGPFKGQDSCVRALEIYNSLFEFDLRSFDIAVSPRTGNVIAQVDVGLKALETGVDVQEDCFLYVTLNDDLLVTGMRESCNSLAEFIALQSKSCFKEIEECARQKRPYVRDD